MEKPDEISLMETGVPPPPLVSPLFMVIYTTSKIRATVF
jgi:hypothetical protein